MPSRSIRDRWYESVGGATPASEASSPGVHDLRPAAVRGPRVEPHEPRLLDRGDEAVLRELADVVVGRADIDAEPTRDVAQVQPRRAGDELVHPAAALEAERGSDHPHSYDLSAAR